MFVVTAYQHFLAPSGEVVDTWQAHADTDLLELRATDDPGQVRGLSQGDPKADEEQVPYLNRDNTAPHGLLIGQERLMAGDRLSWLSDHNGTSQCTHVLFEIDTACQVMCRTWNPVQESNRTPVLLNHVTQPASPNLTAAVRDVLALRRPRSWAPRNPEPEDGWVLPATRPAPPEYWLSQLRPRPRNR